MEVPQKKKRKVKKWSNAYLIRKEEPRLIAFDHFLNLELLKIPGTGFPIPGEADRILKKVKYIV
jgi:hypothetical protein